MGSLGRVAWTAGGPLNGLPDTALERSSAGIVSLTNASSGGGALEVIEITDPAAPGANKARLYVRVNGSGKTQLVVRFNTGAIQILATEP